MDKYATIYLTKLASEQKKASLAGIAKGVGHFIADPFVDTVKDVGATAGAIGRGDWADAGGKALSAGLNGVNAAATASMVIPGLGEMVGLPVKGMAMAGRAALGGSKLLQAAKLTGLASKATEAAGGIAAAEKGLSGVANLSSKIKGWGQGLINAGNKVPGGSWLGLNIAEKAPQIATKAINTGPSGFVMKGLGGLRDMTFGEKSLFHAKNIAKPFATMGLMGMGSDALQGSSLRGQFNDLAVDPNFREWMGPDREDAWLRNVRTDADKVKSMSVLRDGGYVDTYKNHLRDTMKDQQQQAADAARLNALDQVRRQNAG